MYINTQNKTYAKTVFIFIKKQIFFYTFIVVRIKHIVCAINQIECIIFFSVPGNHLNIMSLNERKNLRKGRVHSVSIKYKDFFIILVYYKYIVLPFL